MKHILMFYVILSSATAFAEQNKKWSHIDCKVINGKGAVITRQLNIELEGNSFNFRTTSSSSLRFFIDDTFSQNLNVCVEIDRSQSEGVISSSCTSIENDFVEIGYLDSESGFLAASCNPSK